MRDDRKGEKGIMTGAGKKKKLLTDGGSKPAQPAGSN